MQTNSNIELTIQNQLMQDLFIEQAEKMIERTPVEDTKCINTYNAHINSIMRRKDKIAEGLVLQFLDLMKIDYYTKRQYKIMYQFFLDIKKNSDVKDLLDKLGAYTEEDLEKAKNFINGE